MGGIFLSFLSNFTAHPIHPILLLTISRYNILQLVCVMLWVRGLAILAEVALVANFNPTVVYFRELNAPRPIHFAVSDMPLTSAFFMNLWNGAVMAHCHSLACRLIGNVSMWRIAALAAILLAFKNNLVGYYTPFLAAGLGIGYGFRFCPFFAPADPNPRLFFAGAVAFRWPSAFATAALAYLLWLGKF